MPKQEVSIELYHRIYRLLRKGADCMRIAAAVELPLKTVQNIVARFKDSSSIDINAEAAAGPHAQKVDSVPCEAIVFSKGRYALVDLTGQLVNNRLSSVLAEFGKLLNSEFKAFALRMKNVTAIDAEGFKAFLSFYEQCSAKQLYVAILDPSEIFESVLKEHQGELTIPIFGTESTFEKNAFAIKTGLKFKK